MSYRKDYMYNLLFILLLILFFHVPGSTHVVVLDVTSIAQGPVNYTKDNFQGNDKKIRLEIVR